MPLACYAVRMYDQAQIREVILSFLARRAGFAPVSPGRWQRRRSPLRYAWDPHRHPRDLKGRFIEVMRGHQHGELRHVGGLPVRRHGDDKFSVETEKGQKHGTADEIAAHIVADMEQRRLEGKPWLDALGRTEGWTEPDALAEPDRAEQEAAGFAKLPRGTRVVSLDPNMIGRLGTVVTDKEGGKAVRMDGTGEVVSSVAFEPLDARHSWRAEGMPAGPAPRQGGLFDFDEELPPEKPSRAALPPVPEVVGDLTQEGRRRAWREMGFSEKESERRSKMGWNVLNDKERADLIKGAEVVAGLDRRGAELATDEQTADFFKPPAEQGRLGFGKPAEPAEKPESVAESLQKAADATNARQEGYAAKLNALPDGTVIKSGRNTWTKEDIDGDIFWARAVDGKYRGHFSSRDAFVNMGAAAVDAAVEAAKAVPAKPAAPPSAAPEPPPPAASDESSPPGGDSSPRSDTDAHPRLALAATLEQKLRAGEKITAASLLAAADRAYGGTRAEGKHDPSGVYDSLEAGFNRSLDGETDPTTHLDGAIEQAEAIKARVDELPTQTNRSGKKVSWQQFSTPPHYAYAVAWLANMGEGDLALEPSAGTGCLAVHAKNSGADVVLNELDPDRAQFLKAQFGDDKVSIEDASHLGAILPNRGIRPTVVVMNPPFSQTAGRMGDKKDLMTGANHITQALQALAPGGRLVAIVGGGIQRTGGGRAGMAPESPTYAEWFRKLAANGYDLRANVGVSGDEYKKYGTDFGTRVLVIDKTGGTFAGHVPSGDVESIPDLMRMLEVVRNDRPEIDNFAPGERSGDAAPAGAGGDGGRDAALLGAGADGDAGSLVAAGGSQGDPAFAGGDNELVGGRPQHAGPPGEDASAGPGVAGAEGTPGQPAGEPAAGKKRRRSSGGGGGGGRGRGGAGGKPADRVKVDVPQLVHEQLGELRPVAPVPFGPPLPGPAPDEQGGDQADLGPSIYEPYRPSVSYKNMHEHVTPLVESAAMAAVPLPKITYQPHLSPDLVENKKVTAKLPDGSTVETHLGLSEAGLETVALMGQAHSQWLPSEDVQGADGASVAGVGFRRGAMCGDGTGSGKGRSVAGVIVDNQNQGRTKHVWLSKNYGLINDAKRDIADLGGDPSKVFSFDELRGKAPPADGICFIPYSTLRDGPKDKTKPQNLDILVNWLGKDFEGVIAFDEAHLMANSTGAAANGRQAGNPSKMALAGIALQQALPKARVGYWTATAATEPSNLLYAERLGLWGPGTQFPTKQEFAAELAAGGTAALEAVAQSMKAMGMYNARSVSLDDRSGRVDEEGNPLGRVLNHKLECFLSDVQKQQYDGAAEGWQAVMKKIDEVTEKLGGKRSGKSQFWSAEQRFFNQILTCFATNGVIKSIDDDLAAGRAPVIQLVNTMKASMDRAMQSREEDVELDELDVGPKEILLNFLDQSFPIHRLEEYVPDPINAPDRTAVRPARTAAKAGPKGATYGVHTYPPGTPIPRELLDEMLKAGEDIEGGELIVDPEALAERERLKAAAEDLKIPESPLDQIIHKFGADQVAEITGRDQRFVWNSKGDKLVEKRGAGAQEADTAAFQDGRKKVLVFSGAGNTGKSYHADRRAKNQGRRVHYVLQPGWSAAPLMQALGRTHRSNQTSAPIMRPVGIPEVPGNKRFLSSASRRLEQQGALTRGQRQASGGIYSATDNLESQQAIEGLGRFWSRLQAGVIPGLAFEKTLGRLGYTAYNDAGEPMKPPPITQFLNRILILPLEEQNRVFDAFEQGHRDAIALAEKEGRLDKGVENFPADRIFHEKTQEIYTEPTSGAKVHHVVVRAQKRIDRRPWERNTTSHLPVKFVRNKAHNGKVWAVYEGAPVTDPDTGDVHSTYILLGSAGGKQVVNRNLVDDQGHFGKFTELNKEEAEHQWNQEFAALPQFKETEEHFVTGALLPIWKKIPLHEDYGDHPRIFRIKMDDGRTVVGRHVGREQVQSFLRTMGVHMAAKTHAAADVHRKLLSGEFRSARLANGWKLRQSRIGTGGSGARIEVIGPSIYDQDALRQGLVLERIASKPHFFIPAGEDGAAVLDRLTKNRPVAEVHYPDDDPGMIAAQRRGTPLRWFVIPDTLI